MTLPRICSFTVLSLACFLAMAREDAPLTNGEAKTPEQEKATFQLLPGFRIDLVACEPQVIDPVAMCFDEAGALYVAEMIGYPNGGVATGVETRGRIRKLTDRDGDGFYETSAIFADGLRFPSGIAPWRGGLIVCNAPDIVYLKDTKGAGKADERRVLYTGFDLRNIQQLVNTPQYGFDNFIHGMAGLGGGTVTSPEKPEMRPLDLRGRGIRFNPDIPGSIEPTSGGGQYGLTEDDAGRWFTNTNAQHLRQIVLPDHYLKRNPYLTAPAVTLDIPEHGPAARVFRISPFEAWRVERTTNRKADPKTAKRLPSTELVPGGYFTSACSPVIYEAELFPEAFRGNNFCCDPANNLIHREVLDWQSGSHAIARRVDEGKDFLASTDNWFRPVQITLGPDGALYVLDFYREAIETPLSLPDDLKKRMNLESRQRGRIWRIAPEGAKPGRIASIAGLTPKLLIEKLGDANLANRLMAQRLIRERCDEKSFRALVASADAPRSETARIHLNYLRQHFNSAESREIDELLKSPSIPARIHALRQCEPSLKKGDAATLERVLALIDDPSAQIRFQLALTLGESPQWKMTPKIADWIVRDAADPWFGWAALSSLAGREYDLFEYLVKKTPRDVEMLKRLANLTGAAGNDARIRRMIEVLAQEGNEEISLPLLEALSQGVRSAGGKLSAIWSSDAESVRKFRSRVESSIKSALDSKAPAARRASAIALCAVVPFDFAAGLAEDLFHVGNPAEIQSAYVKSLSAHADPRVGAILVQAWPQATPVVRREILEAIFSKSDRLPFLLEAIEKDQVNPSSLDSNRLDLLRHHPVEAIRARAAKSLAKAVDADRQKVVAAYEKALQLPADRTRGKAVFAKNCTACHLLETVGKDVGANLQAALPNKTKPALLIDILDPSREVDPRFLNYVLLTKSGRTVTGILAVETPSSITLRRADKAEDTILRTDIETLQATRKSLMPEDFEKQIPMQEMVDLLEYLMTAKN